MTKRFINIIILILSSGAIQAQTVFHSLDEAWKYAGDHNITIRNSRYELKKSQDAHTQSYLQYLPTAGLNGAFTDNTALPVTLVPESLVGKPGNGYFPVKFGQAYIYNGGFTAQMDILNLQTWFNVSMTKATEAMNNASLANNHKLVCQQVASQYYGLILANEALKLSKKEVDIADSVYQSVNHKYKEGTASKPNVDVAALNLDRSQETWITAQYQAQTAKNNLKLLLDIPITDSLIIIDGLEGKQAEQSFNAFNEDPAIKMAFYQVDINRNALRSVKSGIFPNVTLGYYNSTQQNNTYFKPFQGLAPWYPTAYWQLKATWNIFTAGNRWLQTQQSKINYEESMLQYENTQKQSVTNDENLKLAYTKAVALYQKSKDVMEMSFDNYTHITNRYNTGIASLEDRLSAFSDYINYQNQYLNNLSDMLVQLYNIKIRETTF